ncbi:MAG: hypothetical protein GY803_22255, partial [Chloroflexi bacterium]|nr:hypothetical protein [Chloroflexota bacterium]
PINVWALIILALGVFPFMLAVRKSGNMLYLVISIFAMLIGSTFLFQGEGLRPAVHPALALVVSAFAAGFMWIVTYKTLEALGQTPSHDMGKVIGAVGIAKSDVHLEGSVLVAREEWSAQSDDLIKAGTQVRVLGREGFILEVQPLNADDHGGDSPPGA